MEVLEKEQVKFDEDSYQQRCIDSLEGKYLVLAGPGTGKTYTLSQRIKNIIELGQKGDKLGTTPERILCLTYTDAGATEMLNKVRKSLNDDDIEVNISTFHSFCMELIKTYSSDFEIIGQSKVITDAISRYFIKEIMDTLNLNFYVTESGSSYFYINEIKDGIDEIKKNNMSDEKFAQNLNIWKKELAEMTNIKELATADLEKITDYYLKISKEYDKADKEWGEAKDNWKNAPKGSQEKRELNQIKNELSKTANEADEKQKLTKKIGQMEELLIFHKKYREKMEERRYIDFNDMITEVLKKLRSDSAFADIVASQYDYIMVDEYQDTSPLQNQIIFELCAEGRCKNLLAVGDDDQTIYSFQGAKLSTMTQYLEHFNIPDDNVICYKNNRRFTKSINKVSRAQVLLQQPEYVYQFLKTSEAEYKLNCTPLEHIERFKKYGIDKELNPVSTDYGNEPVECIQYADGEHEKIEVLNKIENIIDTMKKENRLNYREIAVLCRSNSELMKYAELLENKGIPYELKEGRDIFEITASNVLFYYLSLLVNPDLYSDKFLSYLLSEPFSINSKDYTTIAQKMAHSKNIINTMSSILRGSDKEKEKIDELKDKYKNEPLYKSFIDLLENEDFTEHKKIEKFLDNYYLLQKMTSYSDIKNTILKVIDVTGILDYYCLPKDDNDYARNYIENMLGIKKLVSEAEGFENIYKDIGKVPNLQSFVEYIQDLTDKGAKIPVDKPSYELNAVQLSTCHSSKGKEYEYVFMPKLNSRTWEGTSHSYADKIPMGNPFNDKLREKEQKFTENAKLMFVGMTRAKRKLWLSFYKTRNDGKSWFIKQLEESRYLEIEDRTNEYNPEDAQYKFLKTYKYEHSTEFDELINSAITNKVFSASDLNNYLACPRKYYYENILGLVPTADDSDYTSYGSAIHYACEMAIKHVIEPDKKPLSKEEFLEYFRKRMDISIFSSKEKKAEFLRKGEIIINGKGTKNKDGIDETSFYDLYFSDFDKLKDCAFKTEQKFDFEINGHKFRGYIDRIDKDENNSYIIYDYKTGKPDEKEIKPDGKKEGYYNQMAIYKYALNKSGAKIDGKEIKNISKTIFICPDQLDNIDLELSDTDCEAVKDRYMEARKSIVDDHDFDTVKRDSNACDYCTNRAFCGMELSNYLKEQDRKSKEQDKK